MKENFLITWMIWSRNLVKWLSPKTLRDYLTLLGTIENHPGLFWTICDYSWQFRTNYEYISDFLRLFVIFGKIQDYLEVCILNFLRIFDNFQEYLGVFWNMFDYSQLFETIGLFWTIRDDLGTNLEYYGLFETIWN